MGIKIKNLQTGEFEKFNIPALKGEKGEPGEIEPSEKVDYIGKQHSKLRDTMNANVDYIIKTAIGEFNYLDYEGQHITATNSIEGHAKSAILNGQTLVNLAKVRTATAYNRCSEKNIAIKPNTKYIALFNPTYYEAENGANYALLLVSSVSLNDSVVGGDDAYTKSVSEGRGSEYKPRKGDRHLIFTSKANETYLHIRTGGNNGILYTDMIILEYQEGMENWDIPYFEGMQSVKMPVLKTTGKNLFDSSTKIVTGQGIDSITGLPYNASTHSYTGFLRAKPNTTYTITQSHNKTWVFAYNKNKEYIGVVKTDILSGGNFTTPNDTYYIRLDFNTANTSEIVNGVQIEEGTTVTSFESYKTNILSCQPTPLSQSMFEQGSFSESTPYNTQPYENVKLNSGQHYGTRIRVKDTCKVVGGETYGVQLNDGYGIFICYCKNGLYSNTENKWIDMTNFTFTVPKDCDEMFFALRKTDNTQINTSEYPLIGLKIHQDITLRAIGDVKDTLNLMTGEYIQRIGEVVLDGSELNEHYQIASTQGTNTLRIDYLALTDAIMVSRNKIACDKFIVSYDDTGDYEHIRNSSQDYVNICIYIDKTRLTKQTIAGFKQWLSTNPVTIQYELKTPIIKTVDLSGDVVYSYNEVTHYDCSSEEGSLVPTLSVDVPTDTQLTIQEQKATTQTLLIKNMDLQQSIKEVQAMNLAFNTALYNSFNSIREEVEDIKKHVSTNENLEGSF